MGGLAIVVFFVGLLAVILIHELGHYAFARLYRFRVLEYFVGFGPKLWSTVRNRIEYGVKALPLGGYVKIAGMNPYEEVAPEDVSSAYFSKPIWKRGVVIAAGPFSHFLVAGVLFASVLFFVGDSTIAYRIGSIDRKLADGSISPAYQAGIEAGDVILRAGGLTDPSGGEFGDEIDAYVGRPMPLSVQRDGEVIDMTVVPVMDCVDGTWGGVAGLVMASEEGPARVASVRDELPDRSRSPAAVAGLLEGDVITSIAGVQDPSAADVRTQIQDAVDRELPVVVDRDGERVAMSLTPVRGCVAGLEIARIGVVLAPDPLPLPQAAVEGGRMVWVSAIDSVKSIGRVFGPEGIGRVASLLFTDAEREVTDPASVVGIGQQVGAVGGQGQWAVVVAFLAYVTVFIGLVNLIPLPPFDGGHLLMLAIEKIRGRAVDMRRVIPVSVAVMAFLVTFVMATVIVDITKPLPTP
jgi:regulator of sigma E protease